MVSDPLALFKVLPRTDCGECGHPTCLVFARALATGRVAPTACLYVANTCPGCGHFQEMLFRKCPKCGVSLLELRKADNREATACPKCGYASGKPFSECPQCGVSIAVISKTARKGVAAPKAPQPQEKPRIPAAGTDKAPASTRPVTTPRPDGTPPPDIAQGPGKKFQSVADMTSAPSSSMDTESYFKKKSNPTRHCPYCGFSTQEDLPECPQCGQSGEWQTVGA